MVSKHIFVGVALSCLAVAFARNVPEVRNPVGSCPAIDGELPVYLPDESNCAIFYECDDGVANPKECMQGLCFDTTLNVCAFPKPEDEIIRPLEAVGTCPPRDTNITVFLPDSENCTIYYVCSNGRPIKNECPPDMSWNNDKDICDWDLDANCNHNGYKRPLTAVGTCPPRDTNITVFLPDSDDCTIYYVCSNGKPIKNECPPEMSWNNDKDICDWDLDANCNHDSTTAGTTQGTTAGTVEIAPLSAVGTCPPRDTNVTVFLPDSANCSIYYICSNGRPFAANCVPGMVWSTRLNICDWDADNDCVPDSDQALKMSGKAAYSPVGECPEKNGNMPVFLPDSDRCNFYYECSNGEPIENSCAPGLAWNSLLNTCDFDLNEDCILDSQESRRRVQPRSPVGECPPENGPLPTYLPDSDSCQFYYECDEGVPIKNNCPGDLEWNPVLDVCDDPLDAGCKAGGGTTSGPGSTSSVGTTQTPPTTTNKPAF